MFDIKVEKLSKGLDFLSIDYDHNLLNKFILYYEFLNKENKKYNLTSITDFDDFISLHVLDSLSVLLPIQKYNKTLIALQSQKQKFPFHTFHIQENLFHLIMLMMEVRET